MKQPSDYCGFIQQLPIVFEILKHNPDSIVDDTAIERLLNWMEVMSSKLSSVECCIDFLTCDEIWQQPTAFSFALRLGGYIGSFDLTQENNNVILRLLTTLQTHPLLSNATVQFGFFKCLASLAKNSYWFVRLQDYLDIMLLTFSNSYLYVKKSAVIFLVQYLQDTSQCVCVAEYLKKRSLSCEQMTYILETITKLFEINYSSAKLFCTDSDIIKTSMSSILSEKNTLLLERLISLFSFISRHGVDNWDDLLKSTGKLDNELLSFVKSIKFDGVLNHYVPALCSSLIQYNLSFYFPDTWNSILLRVMLASILQEDRNFLSPFQDDNNSLPIVQTAWKKYLVIAIDFMNNIEKMNIPLESSDHLFVTLMKSWQIFIFKVLQTSLSCGLNEQLSSNYICLINDKKITRLCCAYIKSINFQNLSEDVNEKLATCIVVSLQSHAEVPQVTSSLLELLARYIGENDENLRLITALGLANNVCLAELLNMKLWDICWEVKDSLLNVLIQIAKGAVKGYKSHHEFLSNNLFWCKIMPLLNDSESYIRSKTVEFLTHLVLFVPIWRLFEQENSLSLESLWKRLAEDFTCPSRQDDFFTRRSVLEMLLCCVSSSNTLNNVFSYKSGNSCVKSMKESISCILKNCASDLDWEVRKLNIILWTAVISGVGNDKSVINDFADFLIQENFVSLILLTLCDDEYAVKIESVKCLRCLRTLIINEKQVFDKDSIKNSVTTIEEFENSFKKLDLLNGNNIVHFFKCLDLDSLLLDINILDDTVKGDPQSFLEDIISSAKESDSNLLDCY